MTEDANKEFDNIEDEIKHAIEAVEIPLPSTRGKQEALRKASEEFAKLQKNENKSEGISRTKRPIFETINQFRRETMRKSLLIGSSLAACAVIYFGYNIHMSQMTDYAKTNVGEIQPVPTGQQVQQTSQTGHPQPTEAKEEETWSGKTQDVADKGQGNIIDRLLIDGKINEGATTSSAPQPLMQTAPDMITKNKVSRHFAEKKIMTNSTLGGIDSVQAEMAFAPADVYAPQGAEYVGRDKFDHKEINPIKLVSEEPVSTFSIDVDTSSYAFMRRELNRGRLPQKDAIRIEELVNYFDYDYELPTDKAQPFKPTVNVFPTPWNADTKLVHIGIKGYDIEPEKAPKSNLVFLLDVSGSMSSQDKLPLLKNSFKMMVENMDEDSTVSIVVYAGAAGTVLEPTKVKDKGKILAALERLSAGGSTAGGEGIRQAYALAEANYDKDAVNRVILATDGDFNVGIYNKDELKGFVERKRKTGIYLSVLGFGQGNYNDALMQELAQNGNGNAAYIDNLNEARKVLVDEATSTLFPIANDVKIQVEFNPKAVAEYRLIGYESRMLKREDFNNDKVDAGDIGAGHSVTALYEITPVGSKAKLVDDLRYVKKTEDATKKKWPAVAPGSEYPGEYAFLKMRYKTPGDKKSKLLTTPITVKNEQKSVDAAIGEARFATAVAAFAQMVRGDEFTADYTFDDVAKLAKSSAGEDEFGYRHEFLQLVRLAKSAADLQNTNNRGRGHITPVPMLDGVMK